MKCWYNNTKITFKNYFPLEYWRWLVSVEPQCQFMPISRIAHVASFLLLKQPRLLSQNFVRTQKTEERARCRYCGIVSRYSDSGEQSWGRMTPYHSKDEARYSEGGAVSAVWSGLLNEIWDGLLFWSGLWLEDFSTNPMLYKELNGYSKSIPHLSSSDLEI